MEKRKIRILCSPTIAIWSILMMIILCGFYVLSLVDSDGREVMFERIPFFIFWTLFVWGLSIALIITGARRIFSIITIDETGVSRSFLSIFYKLHISWEEMAEIWYVENLLPFLFFSKTKKVSEMTYNKAIAVKDAVQISFSKRRYKFIAQYMKQPIVGLPDYIKDQLSNKE